MAGARKPRRGGPARWGWWCRRLHGTCPVLRAADGQVAGRGRPGHIGVACRTVRPRRGPGPAVQEGASGLRGAQGSAGRRRRAAGVNCRLLRAAVLADARRRHFGSADGGRSGRQGAEGSACADVHLAFGVQPRRRCRAARRCRLGMHRRGSRRGHACQASPGPRRGVRPAARHNGAGRRDGPRWQRASPFSFRAVVQSWLRAVSRSLQATCCQRLPPELCSVGHAGNNCSGDKCDIICI